MFIVFKYNFFEFENKMFIRPKIVELLMISNLPMTRS